MRKVICGVSVTLALLVPAVAQGSQTREHTQSPFAVHRIGLTPWQIRWNRKWNRRFDRRWLKNHPRPPRPPYLSEATASWYYDTSGACASGSCAYFGVANLSLPFGTHVEFCYPWPSHNFRCQDAVVDDRGPYVGGRTWDLNEHVAAALGFSGVQAVGYHIG